jgi:MFS family permease
MNAKHFLKKIYLAGFLFSFHTALTVYINSSFLATKIPESLIGILYTASAIVSIIGLFVIPRIMSRLGSRTVLGTLLIINIGNILGLIFSHQVLITALCFVFFFGLNTILYLGLDILIEHFADERIQGTIRGSYLTANNIGFMMAPLIAGYIIDRLGFGSLYGFSLLLIFPVLVIICLRIPNIKQAHISKLNIFSLIKKFLRNKHLRSVFMINGTLQFFYVWMTVYTPIYLHEHVGIAWDDIGLMFTVMLSAFVLFQYIIGKIADRFHCEKYLMMLGLLIMGIATLFIVRAPLYSLTTLALILFTTRVGASIVEVVTESYFFKHVHPDDVGSIGFFRNTYPFASIFATLFGAGLLQLIPLWSFFIVLGVIILFGIIIIIPLTKKPY